MLLYRYIATHTEAVGIHLVVGDSQSDAQSLQKGYACATIIYNPYIGHEEEKPATDLGEVGERRISRLHITLASHRTICDLACCRNRATKPLMIPTPVQY